MNNSEATETQLGHLHQLILKSVGDGVYGLDPAGRATFVNDAAVRLLGWNTEDLKGKALHDVHHHSYADGSPYPREACPIYAALKDGDIHKVNDEVFWHADGHAVPVEYISTPIIENGQIRGAVVVFRDISERLQNEAQREQDFEQIKTLKNQLEQERDYLRDEINVNANFGEIIGASDSLKRTLSQIEAVAKTPSSVLILGESGVGKEMIARAIHQHSDRECMPLGQVNCASIPKEFFESEFFGHVKGAFTGAHRDRVGKMQLADKGTLFLDEVGEIPLDLQGKLLRALQEREFERVGDERTQQVDVRIIAATNRDLLEEVRAGRFREDLYYRLSVFPVEVPPLKDRSADIAPLAQHFLETYCLQLGISPPALSLAQIEQLKAHDWPGNIRELKNIIERAVILSTGANRLKLELALPANKGTTAAVHDTSTTQEQDILSPEDFKRLEAANFRRAMERANWKISGAGGAAELLGIKPSTLAYRLSLHGISKPD
jgi:PAS domain S-box-containing protein